MKDKKEAPFAEGAETKVDASPYYRRRDRESRKFRRRMRRPVREEGVASDYIGYLPDMIERGEVKGIVLYARKSSYGKESRAALSEQMEKLKGLVQPYGIPIVARYCEMYNGKRMERPKLLRADAMARRENAVIVAETPTRLLRPDDYDPHDRDTWKHRPTDAEYRHFLRANPGVVFATAAMHPDGSSPKERSYQTKRGHEAKGNKGGRPKKLVQMTPTERRLKLLPKIQRLRSKKGPDGRRMGFCKIAEEIKANWPLPCETHLSSATVMRWLEKYGE